MLNRRTLRIKAMQAIYAYMQAEGSDYLLAIDQIEETFAPDLNSMEVQDRDELEGKKQIATLLFKEWYTTRQTDTEETNPSIRAALNNAINLYQNAVKKDFKFYGNNMLSAVEKIYDNYLLLLQVMPVMADLIKGEQEKKATRYTASKDRDLSRLLSNQVLLKLQNNKDLQEKLIRRGVSWAANMELLRQFYRETLKSDEMVIAYLSNASPVYADDHELLKHIYKNIIFKEKNLQSLFEELDLNWEENKPIVKSLVMKTLKQTDEAADENMPLLDLSANWEDDRQFFQDLFYKTLEGDARFEEIITKHLQNWDIERTALIDKIILKMALCEMLEFRSIPVKVTINEYIEVSKLYSTPKSKQFINGVLDKMALDLQNTGQIRKTGRGLMDNQ